MNLNKHCEDCIYYFVKGETPQYYDVCKKDRLMTLTTKGKWRACSEFKRRFKVMMREAIKKGEGNEIR